MQDTGKEFKPTSWAIDNKVSIYVATVIICLLGIVTYNRLPKENFPEVVFPQIYVATPYAGSPTDIENLISKQIEKQVKSIAGVKKITSNSIQNFSNVIVDFETDVDVTEAKREVQDAVDKAKRGRRQAWCMCREDCGDLGRKSQYHKRIAIAACVDDFPGGALGAHRDNG